MVAGGGMARLDVMQLHVRTLPHPSFSPPAAFLEAAWVASNNNMTFSRGWDVACLHISAPWLLPVDGADCERAGA
jgi:hypothetical protein